MNRVSEYQNLFDEIEMNMSYDMDYFITNSETKKEEMEGEMTLIADEFLDKVESSNLNKEQKAELTELINSKLDDPQIPD